MQPIVADAEAGFGGVLNAFELMKAMIEAGAAGVHFEDQLASVKKALESVTVKIQAQNASINDLLAEGADIAQRLQEKMSRASKAVANPTKKR